MPFSGQNMAIFDQKLWSEPFNNIFIGSVLNHYSSEHTVIHFNALLRRQVMKKWQKWSKMHFLVQNSMFRSKMVIFDQKLWSEPSNDIFIWSVSKHYSSEHSFIHFNVLLSGQVMKKCRNGLKCHFLVKIWSFLTRNCGLSHPTIFVLDQYQSNILANKVTSILMRY